MSKIYFVWLKHQKGGFKPEVWYGSQGMTNLPETAAKYELPPLHQNMRIEKLLTLKDAKGELFYPAPKEVVA